MKKDLLFFVTVLLIIIAAVSITFSVKPAVELNTSTQASVISHVETGINLKHFADRILESPGIFVLQLIIILLVVRLMGYLFQRMGQPLVIGEIVAGLLLGPSVLGAFAPQITSFLFPEDSVVVLKQLSQLGLIFFMFIIGMELDLNAFRQSANKAFLISIASISAPFVSGIILAFFLYSGFSFPEVSFASFALFLGTTLCITAFPILARIVQERKLTKTPIGNFAISAAAIGDVIAWCILAVVIAIMRSRGIANSLLTIGLAAAFIVFMLLLVKPFMYRMGNVYASREVMGKPIVAFVFLLMLISTLTAEAIGINALFGAFMAGVVMPENLNFKRVFTEKIEDVALVILLPLFFVATGLRTEIGLINTPHLWMVCLVIILVGTISKISGTMLASRYVGLTWNHSLILGMLMNSRGLMELIVLNIGYDLGILTPELFSMLVLMALTTTIITGPGLSLIENLQPKKEKQELRQKPYKILLSFANPKMGPTLLNLTHRLASNLSSETLYTALHISPRSDLSPEAARVFEKESFAPIRRTAEENQLALNTIYLNSSDIHSEIMQTCENEQPNFLILGSARTVFSSDILGGVVRRILPEVSCDVLIFNEKNFKEIKKVLILYFNNGDDYLLNYARLLKYNNKTSFYFYLHSSGNNKPSVETEFSEIPAAPVNGSLLQPDFLKSMDLIMITARNWKTLEEEDNLPIDQFPSLLIIHKASKENKMLKNSSVTN
ncbi:MAG: cation:proton antiporter [Bacteroidales bacterium]|nr:cation:proton antiporter [Bacteroidales bacterium]